MARRNPSAIRQTIQHSEVLGIRLSKCNDTTRLLRVGVSKAVDLMKKDIFGASDPYCKVMLYNSARSVHTTCRIVQTRTIKKTLNPVWNEEFLFRVNPSENRLVFELFDENRITRDDFLGVVYISLNDVDIATEDAGRRYPSKTYVLRPKSVRSPVRGRLYLNLSYLPTNINPRISHTSQLPSLTQLNDFTSSSTPDILSSSVGNRRQTLPNTLPNVDEACDALAVTGSVPMLIPTRSGSANRVDSLAATSSSGPASLDDSAYVEMVEDPLPPGWDQRMDQNGRTYYVDHVNRRTQWDRPTFPLPEGWEQRTDTNGRVYYVDHINSQTTWYHPLSMTGRSAFNSSRSSMDDGSETDSEGQEVDGQSTEQTDAVFPTPPEDIAEAQTSPADATSTLVGTANRPSQTHRRGTSTANSRSRSLRGAIAVDVESARQHAIDETRAAQTMYMRRRQVSFEDTLSHPPPPNDAPDSNDAATTPRPQELDIPEEEVVSDLTTPTTIVESADRFDGTTDGEQPPPDGATVPSLATTPQRSSTDRCSIVVGIDLDSDEEPLPPGWQVARTAEGRRFYINHVDHHTTWDDPRRKSPADQSSPDVHTLLADAEQRAIRDLGPLPSGWEERVHSNGRIFYINHNARTTQWEDPRLERLGGPAVPYSRNFKQRYDHFRSRLRSPRDPQSKLELRVSRNSIFEDSFRQIYPIKKPDYLMHRLWIEFIHEKGLDYGGVQREWFFLLSREMFNPYYGLFEYSAADTYTLQINPSSGLANEDHLKYFKFIGRVVGMAIYHGKLIDGFFIRPFYKMMLEKSITLKDMEAVDSEYYRSLKYILDGDPSELDLTFAVDEEHFGNTVQVDLIPNGRQIPVTNANKKQYIECIISWRFVSRIKPQMWAFLDGLKDLVDLETLKIFDANELELLICGLQDISVSDWKANTLYKGEYHRNHHVIVNFWRAVYTFPNELRSRLLQFVTGTTRVPMNGFSELWGSNGLQKFTIECWGNPNQLPRAHTCFNRLDLPPYKTFNELRSKLIIAMENAEGFEGVD